MIKEIVDIPAKLPTDDAQSGDCLVALTQEAWASTSHHASSAYTPADGLGKRAGDKTGRGEKKEILTKEREMEKHFPGIEFVHDGEKLGAKIDMNGHESKTDQLIARAPTMKELQALDSALTHSAPSYKDPTGKPMKIGFTNDSPVPGIDPRFGPGAAYEEANAKHPDFSYLRIFPGAASMPASQADLKPKDRADISSAHSLEAVLDHELGHATQDHTGGLAPAVDAQYKRAAGWIPLTNPPSDSDDGWGLRGKDGYIYKRVGENGDEHWLRLEGGDKHDEKGRYIGAGYDAEGKYAGHFVDNSGKPLSQKFDGSQKHAAGLSTPEMRARALVKPISDYFPMPQEEVAEALRAYRTSAETRRRLLEESAPLYRAAGDLDQLEIDGNWGPGQAVRSADGVIVPVRAHL